MEAETQMIIGAMILSCTIAYAWWGKVRVIRFREDIFEVRDNLWDEVKQLAGFDDPAYMQARERLNAQIALADGLSVSTLFYLFLRRSEEDETLYSDSTELQAAIDKAIWRGAARARKYVFSETLSGALAIRIISLGAPWPNEEAEQEIDRGIGRCFGPRVSLWSSGSAAAA